MNGRCGVIPGRATLQTWQSMVEFGAGRSSSIATSNPPGRGQPQSAASMPIIGTPARPFGGAAGAAHAGEALPRCRERCSRQPQRPALDQVIVKPVKREFECGPLAFALRWNRPRQHIRQRSFRAAHRWSSAPHPIGRVRYPPVGHVPGNWRSLVVLSTISDVRSRRSASTAVPPASGISTTSPHLTFWVGLRASASCRGLPGKLFGSGNTVVVHAFCGVGGTFRAGP